MKIILNNNKELHIDNFNKINNLSDIKELYLNFDNIKEIPNNLINLKKLIIENCKFLKYIPDTLINLEELKIDHCYNLKKNTKYINKFKIFIFNIL